MPLSPAAQESVDLLVGQTERDKKQTLGPSQLGNPCDRCLAEQLLATNPNYEVPEGVYLPDMSGRPKTIPLLVGTAVHAYAEGLVQQETMGHLLTETKVTVGEVRGYGEITGSVDLYNKTYRQLLDYKVMAEANIKQLVNAIDYSGRAPRFREGASKAATLKQYYAQVSLYALGLSKAGHAVNSMSLLLIPRDDKLTPVAKAVREIAFPYKESYAHAVLERASRINEWAQENPHEVENLDSHPSCFFCNVSRYTLL